MHEGYEDIIERLGKPLWWDDVCAPRYNPFHPSMCNNIYIDEAWLVEVRCQRCGRTFLMASCWGAFDEIKRRPRLSTLAKYRRADMGDPPAHGCVGDTMSSESVRIVEFWKRGEGLCGDWRRVPELEVATPSWWAETDAVDIADKLRDAESRIAALESQVALDAVAIKLARGLIYENQCPIVLSEWGILECPFCGCKAGPGGQARHTELCDWHRLEEALSAREKGAE